MRGISGLLVLKLFLALGTAVISILGLSWSFLGQPLGEALGNLASDLSWIPGMEQLSDLSDTATVFLCSAALLIPLTLLLLGSKQGGINLVTVLHLTALAPLVLSHSSVNWARFALQRAVDYSTPPLIGTMALVLGVLLGLMLLHLLSDWEAGHGRLVGQRAPASDRERYVWQNVKVGLGMAGGALTMTVAILLLARVVSRGLEQVFGYIPWPMVLLGLMAVSVVTIVIFRLTVEKMSPEGGKS